MPRRVRFYLPLNPAAKQLLQPGFVVAKDVHARDRLRVKPREDSANEFPSLTSRVSTLNPPYRSDGWCSIVSAVRIGQVRDTP